MFHFVRGSKDFFKTINETCLPKIDRVSVPILGIQDDEIKHDRSGVLYQIADEHFVLTAAHNLHQTVEAQIPLYLLMNKPSILPIPLKAKFYSTEEDGRDISVIWLPPDTACEVAKHKEFLSHDQIDLNGAESRGPFVFFGYPMDWSGLKVSKEYLASQALAFVTFPHDGPLLDSTYYDQKIHMVLNFTDSAINAIQGDINILPKLNGISGCGIWQVGDLCDKEVKARDEDSITLVGIQHGWSSGLNYIMATKICFAMSLIAGEFPETKAAMKIIYPKHR
jgi:hypothetical protein